MKNNLAILISSFEVDKTSPSSMITPFVFAQTAKVMTDEVLIFFASKSVELLIAQKCQNIDVSFYHQQNYDFENQKSLYDFICDCTRMGIKIYACSMAVSCYINTNSRLIPETTATAGAAFFMEKALQDNWQVLNF